MNKQPDGYTIEAALAMVPMATTLPLQAALPSAPMASPTVVLILVLRLTPRRKGRGVAKARQTIETICLSAHQAIAFNEERSLDINEASSKTGKPYMRLI